MYSSTSSCTSFAIPPIVVFTASTISIRCTRANFLLRAPCFITSCNMFVFPSTCTRPRAQRNSVLSFALLRVGVLSVLTAPSATHTKMHLCHWQSVNAISQNAVIYRREGNKSLIQRAVIVHLPQPSCLPRHFLLQNLAVHKRFGQLRGIHSSETASQCEDSLLMRTVQRSLVTLQRAA